MLTLSYFSFFYCCMCIFLGGWRWKYQGYFLLMLTHHNSEKCQLGLSLNFGLNGILMQRLEYGVRSKECCYSGVHKVSCLGPDLWIHLLYTVRLMDFKHKRWEQSIKWTILSVLLCKNLSLEKEEINKNEKFAVSSSVWCYMGDIQHHLLQLAIML